MIHNSNLWNNKFQIMDILLFKGIRQSYTIRGADIKRESLKPDLNGVQHVPYIYP